MVWKVNRIWSFIRDYETFTSKYIVFPYVIILLFTPSSVPEFIDSGFYNIKESFLLATIFDVGLVIDADS